MAMDSQILVFGLDNIPISCQVISGKHFGFNSRYLLEIKGVHPFFLNKLYLKRASVQIQMAHQTWIYHGNLLSLKQKKQADGLFAFSLCIGCGLWQLENTGSQRAYTATSLESLIRAILAPYDILVEFDWQQQIPTLLYVAQGAVSDYDFFLRLCVEYGLVFYFCQDTYQSTLHITDKDYQGTPHHVRFNPSNGMVDSENVITALKHHVAHHQANVRLRCSQIDDPSHVLLSEVNAKELSLPGRDLNLSHIYAVKDQAACEHRCEMLQQQVISQTEWIMIEKNGDLFAVGDLLTIHDSPLISGQFQLIQFNFSMNLHGQEIAHPLRWDGLLIPSNHSYRMPSQWTRFKWDEAQYGAAPECWQKTFKSPVPGLQLAAITAQNQSVLDEQGRYRVELLGMSPLHNGTVTHPLPLLQASVSGAQQQSGMHFPLPEKTLVVIAHLNQQMELPIILGALPKIYQESPVVSKNRSQLIWRHSSGAGLEFEDTEIKQTIALQTQADQHGLYLSKNHDQESISGISAGDMDIFSEKSLMLRSGADLKIMNEDMLLQSDAEIHCISESHITCLAQSIEHHADNDWQLLVDQGKYTLNAQQCMEIKARELALHANKLKLKSPRGEMSAHQALEFKTRQTLSIVLGMNQLQLSATAVQFLGANVTLQAPQIIKNITVA